MGSCLSAQAQIEYYSGDHSPTVATLAGEKTDSLFLVTSGECRMCFEKQISDADPVVPLGCVCLGDISRAHELCIRRWFPQRLLTMGRYDCKICKTQLGSRAISILMEGIRSRVFQFIFRRGIDKLSKVVNRMENQLARWILPFLSHNYPHPRSIQNNML